MATSIAASTNSPAVTTLPAEFENIFSAIVCHIFEVSLSYIQRIGCCHNTLQKYKKYFITNKRIVCDKCGCSKPLTLRVYRDLAGFRTVSYSLHLFDKAVSYTHL